MLRQVWHTLSRLGLTQKVLVHDLDTSILIQLSYVACHLITWAHQIKSKPHPTTFSSGRPFNFLILSHSLSVSSRATWIKNVPRFHYFLIICCFILVNYCPLFTNYMLLILVTWKNERVKTISSSQSNYCRSGERSHNFCHKLSRRKKIVSPCDFVSIMWWVVTKIV